MSLAAIIQIQDGLDKLSEVLRDIRVLYPRLRDEIKFAFEELCKLKNVLADKKCIKELNEVSSAWEFQCLQAVYMLQDIADTFLVKSVLKRRKGGLNRQPLIGLISLMGQYRLAKEINNITLGVKTLLLRYLPSQTAVQGSTLAAAAPACSRKWEMFDNSPKTRSPSPRSPGNKLDEDEEANLVGFEEEARKLCAHLMDNAEGLDVVSIVSVPGSGKTALAKTVYNKLIIKKHFLRRGWIQIPVSFPHSNLEVDHVISQFKSTAHDLSLSDEPAKVEKFLIVIEDVDGMEAWQKISSFFPAKCVKGCKVLITTRDINVAHYASTNPIQLNKLGDKDSWTLFLKKACITETDFNNSDLSKAGDHVNLKERILRQCEGLPLTIIMLGGLLCTIELSFQQWLTVIDEHAKSIGSHDQSVYSRIFALSINDLPDELKRCFMYLAIFPRAFDIPVRRLVQLWIAEGLINDNLNNEGQTTEDVAEEFLQTLVDRNLIEVTQIGLKGQAKKCRLLGITYDVILAISRDVGYVYVHGNSCPVNSLRFNVRRLAQYSDINSYDFSDPYIKYIRSYISFNNRRRDSPTTEVGVLINMTTAKRGFGLLRVIDLEGVYKPILPETIGKLVHLRYLGLRWTFLDSLPMSVGNLPLLETLDIKHTNISNLPLSIWKAKNLRHLYMNEVRLDVCKELQYGEYLAKLQTLSGLVIGATSLMVDDLKFLTCLRKLGLTCHCEATQAVSKSISQLKNLQSLKLRSIDDHGFPSNLYLVSGSLRHPSKLNELYLLGKLTMALEPWELPQKLGTLTLSLSELKEDPMPILGRLHNLRVLKLFGRSYVGKNMKCVSHGFPSLYELKLWKLDNLEKWNVQTGAMPSLRKLEIRCCYKLKIVKGLQQHMALNDLTLTNMPEAIVGHLKASLDERKVFIKENKWKFSDKSQVEVAL